MAKKKEQRLRTLRHMWQQWNLYRMMRTNKIPVNDSQSIGVSKPLLDAIMSIVHQSTKMVRDDVRTLEAARSL